MQVGTVATKPNRPFEANQKKKASRKGAKDAKIFGKEEKGKREDKDKIGANPCFFPLVLSLLKTFANFAPLREFWHWSRGGAVIFDCDLPDGATLVHLFKCDCPEQDDQAI